MMVISALAIVLAYLSYFSYFICQGDKLGWGMKTNIDFMLLLHIFAPISFILSTIVIIKGATILSKGLKVKGRICLIAGFGSWIVLATLPVALFLGFLESLTGSGKDPFIWDKVILGFNIIILFMLLILIYKTIKPVKKEL